MKFDDHEQRLVAVEKIASHIKQQNADASIEGRVECGINVGAFLFCDDL